jgi:hypothetical protein
LPPDDLLKASPSDRREAFIKKSTKEQARKNKVLRHYGYCGSLAASAG